VEREISAYGPSSSFKVGELPEGCLRCIKGEKIVLYTTGSCSVGCSYCPIPEDRQKVDDVFVNERPVDLEDDGVIFDESNQCLATGAGITGGDPMEVPERTINYIRAIREKMGNDYHLHLYTSGRFFINHMELIDDLFAAGLDEMRFHPRNLRSYEVWDIAKKTKKKYPDKSIGFEVPAIPNREEDLEKLINFADEAGLNFVNLNEYEFTDTNFNKLSQRGFVSVLTNAAIVGSKDTARKVIEKVKDSTSLSLHFCSSGSKDSIQLVQRYKKRASQTRREFDLITEEGLFQFGEFSVETREDFDTLLALLRNDLEVEEEMMEIFVNEMTVETADYIVAMTIEDIREIIEVDAAIITRFPYDQSPIVSSDPL